MIGIRGIKRVVINILKNLIRVGRVSSINYDKGTVRVTFPDKDDIVSAELPYLSFEYNMPDVQDTVLCIFLGNGISKGFCLGKFYNKHNPPIQAGEQYYYKNIYGEANIEYNKETKTYKTYAENIRKEGKSIHFAAEDGSYYQYDPDTKTLTFSAQNIVLDGDVSITGNLNVTGTISAGGNITSGGSIIDTAGNTNHHSHP